MSSWMCPSRIRCSSTSTLPFSTRETVLSLGTVGEAAQVGKVHQRPISLLA